MTTSNIESFDEITGKAFAKLYQYFPEPVPLEAGMLIGEDNVTDKMSGLLTEQAKFCIACLYWLVEAGYIAGHIVPLGLQNTVLTPKGLETLKVVPASLNAPLGQRLMEAAKTEGTHALRSLASQALGIGLQWLVR